jgi:hypothetical protein
MQKQKQKRSKESLILLKGIVQQSLKETLAEEEEAQNQKTKEDSKEAKKLLEEENKN